MESVEDLTFNDRKVLLIYDRYRSNLGYKVISKLQKGNVVAYCLPAHTSGTKKPLDVGICYPFQYYSDESMYAVASNEEKMECDQFDPAHFVTQAYYKALSLENIKSAFKHTDIWLCDLTMHLKNPCCLETTNECCQFISVV